MLGSRIVEYTGQGQYPISARLMNYPVSKRDFVKAVRTAPARKGYERFSIGSVTGSIFQRSSPVAIDFGQCCE